MKGFKIQGMPKVVAEYVVVRWVDDELWFYGSYHTKEKAEEVARQVSGSVVIEK